MPRDSMVNTFKSWLAKRKFKQECKKWHVCEIHFTAKIRYCEYAGTYYVCHKCHEENNQKLFDREADALRLRDEAVERLKKLAKTKGY